MGSAVFSLSVSELACCVGQQNLVLPQSALTHSSANTELHLKLCSCCPCCTLCQATPQNKWNNDGIFSLFFSSLPLCFLLFFFSLPYFVDFFSLLHSLPFLRLYLTYLRASEAWKICGKCSSHTSHSRVCKDPTRWWLSLSLSFARSLSLSLCMSLYLTGDRGVQVVWVLGASGQGNNVSVCVGRTVIC